MAEEPIVVVLFEDTAEDGARYRDRLSIGGRLAVNYTPPSPKLDLDEIKQQPPDLFLVDYELDKQQSSGEHANYFGGTLAANIREQFPEKPVVLITRENLNAWKRDERLVKASGAFDGQIYKSEVDDAPNKVVEQLVSIATGFRTLQEQHDKGWESLKGALGASEIEQGLLTQTAPPPPDWQVFEAARWIRNVVLAYPGIVYDSPHAATALGISEDAFLKGGIAEQVMGGAKYSGIFAPLEGRWWRTRLYSLAIELVSEEQIDGPVNRAFAEALKKRGYGDVELAKCVYSGEVPADWVCYILKQPVKLEYSLVYHPDNRPSVMDDARVSFKAIRESNAVRDDLFDAESADLIVAIRKGST